MKSFTFPDYIFDIDPGATKKDVLSDLSAPFGPTGELPKTTGAIVSFQFGEEAEFIPSTKVPECDCKCCHFRRYVLQNVKGYENWVFPEAPPHEDAVCVNYDEEEPDQVMPPCPPGYSLVHPGHREPEAKGAKPNTASRYWTECTYRGSDAPKWPVPFGKKWDWKIVFLGIIFDSCHFWTPRRTLGFVYKREGTVSSTGIVTRYPPSIEDAWRPI